MKKSSIKVSIMALVLAAFHIDATSITYNYDSAGRLVSADSGSGKSISYSYDNAGNLIQSSQPGPGILIAVISGNQVQLTWPASPAGYRLQSSPALGTSANWTDAPGTPTLIGDRYTLVVNRGATTFYRLVKP